MGIISDLQKIVINEQILLHGAGRQFCEIRQNTTGGDHAICATQYAEIAVYYAILKACNCGNHGMGFDTKRTNDEINIKFRFSQMRLETLLANDDIVGYIYLLHIDQFKVRHTFEFRTYESRFVRKPIKVTKSDLPFTLIPGQREYKVSLNENILKSFNIHKHLPKIY